MGLPYSKLIILDIGSVTAKAIEVNNQRGIVTIKRKMTVQAQPGTFSAAGIENMENTVRLISDAMQQSHFSANRILLTSSILGLRTELVNISTIKTESRQKNTLTSITALQPYGQQIVDNELVYKGIETTGDNYVLKSLVEVFGEFGYSVLSIESSTTSRLNLFKLLKQTYDYPSKIIIDGSSTANISITFQDCPIDLHTCEYNVSENLEKIRECLSIDKKIFIKIIQTIGLERSTLNVDLIKEYGIDEEFYFREISKVFEEYFGEIQQFIEESVEIKRLRGTQIVTIGGIFDIPYATELFETIVGNPSVLIFKGSITSNFKSKYLAIHNRLGEEMQAEYGNCLGVILRMLFKSPTNVVPVKIVQKKQNDSFSSALLITRYVAVILAAFISLYTVGLAGYMIITPNIAYTNSYDSDLSRLKLENTDLTNKLTAFKTLSKTGSSVMLFVMNYYEPTLSILSVVDSNFLVPANSKDTQAKPEKSGEILKNKTPDDATSKAAGVLDILDKPEPKDDTSETTKTKETKSDESETSEKSKLVIRGVSTNTDSVSKFYSQLLATDFGKNAYFKAAEKQILPSGEEVYLFEIFINY